MSLFTNVCTICHPLFLQNLFLYGWPKTLSVIFSKKSPNQINTKIVQILETGMEMTMNPYLGEGSTMQVEIEKVVEISYQL